MRKYLSVFLTVILLFSLSMPVSASIGGYATPPATASNPQPLTNEKATEAVNTAIQQVLSNVQYLGADNDGGNGQVAVTLSNVSTVSASDLQDMFNMLSEAGIDDAIVQLDTVVDNVVLSRIYLDAETAAKLSGTVDLSVKVTGPEVTQAVNTFEKFFDNNITAVSLGQQGAFGADIKMAVKIDLSNLDTNNLVFYSYDKLTNTYRYIPNTDYYIDENGYLVFTTTFGGDIIISDGFLTRSNPL